jgi:hypothetical protein
MKLLDQVRQAVRVRHFSYRTEQAYVYWAERFVRFHGIKHPNTMAAPEEEAFLTHRAVDVKVAASTMIYTHVMEKAASRVRSPLDGAVMG